MNILAIEDDSLTSRTVAELLTSAGHTVEALATAEAAKGKR